MVPRRRMGLPYGRRPDAATTPRPQAVKAQLRASARGYLIRRLEARFDGRHAQPLREPGQRRGPAVVRRAARLGVGLPHLRPDTVLSAEGLYLPEWRERGW